VLSVCEAQRHCRRRRRWDEGPALGGRHFAGVVVIVLALHAALLLAPEPPPAPQPGSTGAAPSPTLQVRLFATLSALPPLGVTAIPAPKFVAEAPRTSSVARVPGPTTAAVAEAAPAAAPAPAAGEVPIYATRLPPAFTFAYELQRGAQRGRLELQWQPDDDHYQARLSATLGGAPWLDLRSAGAFDAAGIAPLRHTDKRQGRSLQAANFRRDEGRIMYSGPTVDRPLAPGAQDRLSWMLQIAAIAAADPSLVAPGGRITFVVVGVRGEAESWTFAYLAAESLQLAGSSVPTVHLLRQPARPFDTRVEVWLDPARHYLPLRARLSNPPSGAEPLQLEWREALASP
jgi:hypothetical protein